MNAYDNAYDDQLPPGRAQEPGPEHAPSRKEDPIDLAASVYEHGWGPEPVAPAPARADAPAEASRPVVSGPVVPEGFLPRPIGPGPSAVREPRGADGPAVVVPGTGAVTAADAPAGPLPAGTAPGGVVRPASFREPGPLDHIGRKAPAYPAEPTDIPAVPGGDLFGALLPDTVVDGGRFGPVTVRAASVRGDGHRYAAECRQDAVLVVRTGELLLVAVADGVGSQSHSHHGSHGILRMLTRQVAQKAETLLAFLRSGAELDFASLTSRLIAEAADQLAEEARKEGRPPKSYSTTLRALLVPADPAVPFRGFVSVGDGGLLRLRGGGWQNLEAAEAAEGGALISTRTDCLPEAYEHARARLITDTRPGDLLVLCTDGLALPLLKEPELQGWLGERWGSEVPGLAEFLWQTQVRVRSYDDDRSVVCLWEAAP
ncbi:protein phosphatase 2C domain-containing protein [Kitasatospora sp. NPDC015120]|uniref:protein phosphatase 2C domain-containing protein n=1 Tax=Kitasatospora sp. NPDC015120 TaxID=3364023 RepID=UPI0036F46FD5